VKANKLIFQATGLPQDELTFNKWAYLSNNQTGILANENRKKLQEMYGINKTASELSTSLTDIENRIKKMTPAELESPEFYLKVLENIGITGGYALASLNQFNHLKGGLIISSIDTQKTFAENMEVSRNTYKEALKECISLYQNEKLSFEDLQKTDCADTIQWTP
jgi:hypothetical protein